ncbi:cysteine methyltransferase [candidate division MSBL1 archaeon SCGC-AAA259A05]|uniref:methylated-DNA--[protein]-cysteine S-methyltransferase n=1 Tax=candidate division MSBL1 archaeon SCGC-AAA259A05 TaxID=1698259 RepID=A0A133U608_9EURY|nr:cysteine methyltransferase [candidate division MSBL1 archaeon SCGC-AAA259A05]
MPDFQDKVLRMTSKIPKGRVTTYKELAKSIGKTRAYRAVGNALRKNPHPIRIPCHRVVRSDGDVGGFGLGKEKKIELLKEEGVEIRNGKVNLDKYLIKNLNSEG